MYPSFSLVLSLLFLSSAFGPGFQNILCLGILSQISFLYLLNFSEAWWLAFSVAAQSLGTFVAYATLIGTSPATICLSLGISGLTCVLVFAWTAPLIKFKHHISRKFHFYIFPVAFTSCWSILTLVSPAGSWMNPAYTMLDFQGFLGITKIFGLDGINFIVSWGASLLVLGIDREICIPKTKQHVIGFLTLVSFLMILSGAWNLNSYGRFFQTPIEDWEQENINAICLVSYNTAPGGIMERIRRTEIAATENLFLAPGKKTADIILWSETSVSIYNNTEEDLLFEELGRIANATKTLIGIGYMRYVSNTKYDSQNMFGLVLPTGEVSYKYQKVHPVVGVETSVEPGTAPAPLVHVPNIGIVGAGICYDYDFPEYIRKSAGDDASLMLQPGWDWGAIGILHARMDALRAIENGFTLFRCSSGGISGVYDSYWGTRFETIIGTEKFSNPTFAYSTTIPKLARQFTLFTYVGSMLGYSCTLVWGVLIASIAVKEYKSRQASLFIDDEQNFSLIISTL